MTINLKIGTTWKVVATPSVKIGGAWKTVTYIGVKVGGQWKTAYGSTTPPPPALDVNMQNATVSGSRSNAGSVTSSAAVAVASGGTSPYTYAWTKVSGDTFTVTSPTAASTTFSTSLTNGQTKSGVYRCTATDAASATAYDDVTVNTVSTYVPPSPPPSNPPLSANVSPSTVSGTRTGAGSVTTGSASVSVSGGSGSYSYSWSGGGATANNPSGASSSFSMTLTNGQTASASPSCTINSTDGQSRSVGVTANFSSTYVVPALSGLTPSSSHVLRTVFAEGSYSIGSVSVTPVGGTGPYTYSWSPTYSGGVILSGASSSSASFSATVDAYTWSVSGFFTCTCTDALGATASTTVRASLMRDI